MTSGHLSHWYSGSGAYPCPQCEYSYLPGWQHGWAGPASSGGLLPAGAQLGPSPTPPGQWAPQGYVYLPGYAGVTAHPTSDEDIRRTADSYLRSDSRIPPQVRIKVHVREGVVTLNGSVPNKWVKRSAVEIVLYLPGVVDVQNNLQVPRPRAPKAARALK